MLIRMHRGVVGEDRTDWLPGEEHEASEHFGRALVSTGHASPVSGDVPAAPPLTTAGTFAAPSVAVESRDPAPSKRRR